MVENKEISRVYLGNLLPSPGEYIFDPNHNFAEFKVQHVIVGQVWGRFDSISGSLKMAEDPLTSSIQVNIDAASLSTHNQDRDKDLRSERFFDVEKVPQITFVSTGIKTEPGGRFSVEGDLNLRGITSPVSLTVKFTGIVVDPWGRTRAAFRAKTKVNRKDIGLMADLERETGGIIVGKDVVLKLAVEALLKK
jgi:polyisoprenoid-binding protein YceI